MPINPEDAALTSLDKIMGGAITERFNHALQQVFENILDLNTDPKKVRKITLVASLIPTEGRDFGELRVEAKPTLVARKPVSTHVALGADEDGIIVMREITKQSPGQLDMEGNETKQRVARLVPIK